MRRRRGGQAGWSLVELAMVIGVSLVVAALAAPAFAPLGAGARAIGAARSLAARLHRERLEAVRTGRACGLRFETDATGVSFAPVADGNGNGLRTSEVDAGVDAIRGPRTRIGDAFPGVRFAIVDDLPAIDGGAAVAAGSDPLRIGSSILAFSPDGGGTSGTLYLASADDRQFAVRILGATGRVRIFEFERARARWVSR